MDLPAESSTSGTSKSNNTFHSLYSELCRREKVNVITTSKSVNRKSLTTLSFSTERLRLEDWKPLAEALYRDTSLRCINIQGGKTKYQFQPEIDTEEKARTIKHKYSILWTDYMLSLLVKAIANLVTNNENLITLELDGLPLFGQYLTRLCEAMKGNKSITTLSLSNCPIQDNGCSVVCSTLALNVKMLNLSGCDLSSASGQHIAKLVRSQQLKRYSSSWNSSLRYLEPEQAEISGITHINLNCNPKFGNAGLDLILDELKDDLWIKQLDVQKCNITEEISRKIFSTLEYNKSLTNADFSQNDQLKQSTLEKINGILHAKKLEKEVVGLTTVVSGLKISGRGRGLGKMSEDKKEVGINPSASSRKTHQTRQKKTMDESKIALTQQKEVAAHLAKDQEFSSSPVEMNKKDVAGEKKLL